MERMHREDLEQTERGEKRDGGDEEYGRNEQKYKRVAWMQFNANLLKAAIPSSKG